MEYNGLWGKLKPYQNDSPEDKPLTFPVDALPPVLQDMAYAVAENVQVDPAMAATVEMAVTATAVQGKVYFTPKNDNWEIPLNLYTAVVASSGERKTPISDLEQPILDYQKEYNASIAPDVDEYQTKKSMLEAEIKRLTDAKKSAKSASNSSKTEVHLFLNLEKIVSLKENLRTLEAQAIKPINMVHNDFTPEALAMALHEHGERAAVLSDEPGIFETLRGRYSQKGPANIDLILQAYDGTRYEVSRATRKGFVLENPLLTTCIMMQPCVLADLTNDRNFSGRGLLARFLIALPEQKVGKRRYRTDPIPVDLQQNYKSVIYKLLDLNGPVVLTPTPEADALAEEYFNRLEADLSTPDALGDGGTLQSFGAKLHGDCMRIAGLIHCANWAWMGGNITEPVSLKTMQDAIEITQYFRKCGQIAFGGGDIDRKLATNGKHLIKILYRMKDKHDRNHFTYGEINRSANGQRGKWKDAETGLDATLQDLIDRSYIRTDGNEYVLNPIAFDQSPEE